MTKSAQRRIARHPFVVVALAVASLVARVRLEWQQKSSGSSDDDCQPARPAAPLVFGAEQWPDCINPITQCANSSWLQWLVPIHVLPRLAELDDEEQLRRLAAVTELPSTDERRRDRFGPTFTVTYHLNPAAKWDDGTPITSATCSSAAGVPEEHGFADALRATTRSPRVDTPNPQTAVVNFKETYNDWPDLIGGFSGVVLEKSKFPSGPDTAKTMQTVDRLLRWSVEAPVVQQEQGSACPQRELLGQGPASEARLRDVRAGDRHDARKSRR